MKHSYTAAELMKLQNPRLTRDHWGHWVFNASNLTLTHDSEDCEIDLEEMNGPDLILRRMAAIRERHWASSKTIGDHFSAFDDLFNLMAIRIGEFDASAILRKRVEGSTSATASLSS